MNSKDLHLHLRELAGLEETDSPFVSCYLDLGASRTRYRNHITERSRLVARSLPKGARAELKEAVARIEAYLDRELAPESRGAALFARAGGHEYFKALQFRLPLPLRFAVDSTPNIYNLVELEDSCRHYVVVLVSEENVRILEIHLGEVTASTWAELPAERRRVGREWTREHYRASRREHTEKFVKEQIRVVNELMADRGYSHLILAGTAKATARFRKALPRNLESALVDTIPMSGGGKLDAVVDATLASFFAREQNESLATVDKLKRGLYTDGLAVVGAPACRKALRNGQVDTLVIAQEFEKPEVQEELVKLATIAGCLIETVADSYTLLQLGGVGCILRYLLPEQYGEPES